MNILKRLSTNERGTFKVVARGDGVISTAIKYSRNEARDAAATERLSGRDVQVFVLKSDDEWEAVD